ncbi:kinase-like domain-containing protein [Syncephalastrum racemosum]|uniref:PAN2-PAN3 deadenylation complex subunit PAN3 n=1 Tax=Syncephalastrum racemosum TaxID=13706 RepID=A0A1X2HQ34_SYNRA|nr:kinase-like domain-containing protein [Syncephalastrum racemosum]
MMANMGMMSSGQMDPYFYMNFPRQPLQYHLYTSQLPHISNLPPHQRTIQSFFIPDNLREQLTQRNEATLLSASARELGLPQEVHKYHSLYPLDEQPAQAGNYFGHPSWLYKAISSNDGRCYVLLRIEGFRLVNETSLSVVESWRHIRHSNVVSIHEAFTTRAFGDSSLVMVYDYHPCSTTLYHTYFTPQGQAALQTELQANGNNTSLIPEKTLWSYLTQLASAVKACHGSGLAARNIELSKILLTGKNRIRLNNVGALDILQFDSGQNVTRYQQEDLLALGKLMVALACNSLQSFHNLPQSFEVITRYYSPDFKNAILFLLSKPLPTKTIDEVITLMGPRILHEINCSQLYNDTLENELSRELENGRLVRLLSKMGFINERPEFDMDPSWSETGDRYIIKLFRDYVFHQVDENGVPVVDMVHVLTCLNKLDAGVDEKIMLMSRDEQSCLIVSYKEVKNCIMTAFRDLTSGRK